MSNWSATQLTNKGRALDAKVTAGTASLNFTKMKLGSGTETVADIPAMTDLTATELVLGISSCAVSQSDDTICELIAIASSENVQTSFVVRELGVFATDPDDGEILYAVMLDSAPDTMPNHNVTSPVTVTYQVNIMSSNASSISAVIDPAGLVSVSTLNAAINAHDSSAASHAAVFTEYTKTVNAPMFNKRDVITTSGTYTAPVTGWYKITVKGGGGGGGAARVANNVFLPSGGGGEGGMTIAYERMIAGDTANVSIGAGGTGATPVGDTTTTGGSGGDSVVIVNANTYTAGGGAGGSSYNGDGGIGGTGTIYGVCGVTAQKFITSGTNFASGGAGGGAGGAVVAFSSTVAAGVDGGGGAGGSVGVNNTTYKGGDGGDGYVWFEYFDSSLNP